jgi:hypothetical protein
VRSVFANGEYLASLDARYSLIRSEKRLNASSVDAKTAINECADVTNLWFPVKLAQIICSMSAICALSCGYQAAYGGARPAARLTVVAAPSRVPESGALAAIMSGLRGELSRAGVLASGTGYPRAVVEFVRLDERGSGPSQNHGSLVAGNWALARGSLVGVTARAWVEESEGRVTRDTGDIRRTSGHATEASETRELMARDAALDAAGQATGAALGRRLLGEIEVTQEPM